MQIQQASKPVPKKKQLNKMKLKYFLAFLSCLSFNITCNDSQTNHVLLHMLRDKDEAAKQDVLKLVKTVKRLEAEIKHLESNANVALVDYKKTLELLKINLQDILDNYNCSLDLANKVIFTQQDLLNEYRDSNLIKTCIITGLMSSFATWIMITQANNGKFSTMFNSAKTAGIFSWLKSFVTKKSAPIA